MVNLALISGLFAGFLIGFFNVFPMKIGMNTYTYVLYGLIFFVGAGVGSNRGIWKYLKKLNIKIILVPVSSIAGTFLSIIPLKFMLKNLSFRELAAVSAGFGYYSLASFMISKLGNQTLGILALISNLFRELFTIIFSPILAKCFGNLAPIVSGGATSMDTTLPSILNASGKEYSAISIFNGIVLTIVVPIIIPLFF